MKRKLTFVDIILLVIFAFGIFFLSPYVLRQFIGLTKPLDVLWTISGDVIILAAGVLLFYVVDKLLNRFL